MNDLPKGWAWSDLEKATTIILGQSPDSKDVNDTGEGLPFYQGKTEFGKMHPTPRYYCTKPKKIAQTNDILLSVRAPVGPTNIANETMVIGRGLSAIRETELTNYKFVYYYFKSIEYWLSLQGSGTTFKAISGQFIKTLKIPLPPLSEQTQIATLLDNHLNQLDQIKEKLTNILPIIKQFRQSVLVQAVSGRLTEDWRGNDEYIQDDELTYPVGWQKTTLGKAVNYGKTAKKQPDEILETDWVLELEDIEKDSSKILSRLFNAKRQSKSTKNIFKKGDVLYGKLRPYLNKVVIADDDGVCTTEIIPISPNEKVLSYYLFIWLKSPYFMSYVNQITYGVNMPRLGTTDGKNAPFILPPLAEQTQIVQQVEHYFAKADQLESHIKSALENINHMTQSLLHQAFIGNLTKEWRERD